MLLVVCLSWVDAPAALAAAGRRKAFANVLSTINEKPVEVSETLFDFEGARSGDRDASSRKAAGGAIPL